MIDHQELTMMSLSSESSVGSRRPSSSKNWSLEIFCYYWWVIRVLECYKKKKNSWKQLFEFYGTQFFFIHTDQVTPFFAFLVSFLMAAFNSGEFDEELF